jgi:hypothetical protein
MVAGARDPFSWDLIPNTFYRPLVADNARSVGLTYTFNS